MNADADAGWYWHDPNDNFYNDDFNASGYWHDDDANVINDRDDADAYENLFFDKSINTSLMIII